MIYSTHSIKIDSIDIEIKKGRYKKMTLKIDQFGKITVTAPTSINQERINQFIFKHKDWIDEKIEKRNIELKHAKSIPAGSILYRGNFIPFEKKLGYGNNIILSQDKNIISAGKSIIDTPLLIKWYKESAAIYLIPKVAHLAKVYNFSYNKTSIRVAKKRWGSCNSKKDISLNAKLILAPEFVSDAIILHELVHTKQMNHGKLFWSELHSICPEWVKAKKWLNDNYLLIETIWNRKVSDNVF